jgi:hypothetical protein
MATLMVVIANPHGIECMLKKAFNLNAYHYTPYYLSEWFNN